MIKLNKDVLFLIFEELQLGELKNNSNSLYLVNKTWCEIIIPILWKNPWKWINNKKMKSLFCVIISHLSNETKENLRFQGINLSVTQHKPLFDYISFCRYLNLQDFDEFVDLIDNIEESKISIIRNEILKLFINRNTKITHLYIFSKIDYQ